MGYPQGNSFERIHSPCPAIIIASSASLGCMIMRASSLMDLTSMFSGLIAMAVVALIFNGLILSAERLLMPWARENINS